MWGGVTGESKTFFFYFNFFIQGLSLIRTLYKHDMDI